MEITKENTKSIIKSRKLVPSVGNYVLKVTNSTPYTREDGTETHIVNFAAMTPYMVDVSKSTFTKTETTQQQLIKYFQLHC
jgi:hypothetical protein